MKRFKEFILEYVFLISALAAVIGVFVIFLFIGFKGYPIFGQVSVAGFLFGMDWSPTKDSFGILPFIIGSFLATIGALLLGGPLAIATAVFLAEISSPRLRQLVRPAVELLAGIPSVVYGFFGVIIIVPIVREVSGGSGFGLFTAWIVLAIMILPTIAMITEDSINSVPSLYPMSSLALGATKWETISRTILPIAKPGIVNAFILGLGRAIGETIAVMMVIGNAPTIPSSLIKPTSTITSIIALEMSYASGPHQTALFAMGIVLFLISTSLVAIVKFSSKRMSSNA